LFNVQKSPSAQAFTPHVMSGGLTRTEVSPNWSDVGIRPILLNDLVGHGEDVGRHDTQFKLNSMTALIIEWCGEAQGGPLPLTGPNGTRIRETVKLPFSFGFDHFWHDP
jgi:hypothetical protein